MAPLPCVGPQRQRTFIEGEIHPGHDVEAIQKVERVVQCLNSKPPRVADHGCSVASSSAVATTIPTSPKRSVRGVLRDLIEEDDGPLIRFGAT